MSLGKLQKLIWGPSVPVISINGLIGVNTTQQITRDLQRINKSTAQALTIVINSQGGSLVQSEAIGEKVKYFCEQNKLPFYTFADDICTSSAYYLLSMGDKVFANENSLIGSCGAQVSHTSYKEFREYKQIETRMFSTQDNLLSKILDDSESLDPKDKDYLKNLIYRHNHLFINHVKKNRPELQKQEKIPQDVYLGIQAQNLGLIDEIQSYQQFIYEQYPKANLDFVSQKLGIHNIKRNLSQALQEIKIDVEVENQNHNNTNNAAPKI